MTRTMSTRTTPGMTFLSPITGWCAALDDNPDPVFSGRTLGDGVSIDPTVGEVVAPFDGEVVTIPASGHAINLRAENGAECLVHVGIDTVALSGDGFEPLVAAGDAVHAGQLLMRFDLDVIARRAPSLRTPVLLLNAPGWSLNGIRAPGPVAAGEPLFDVIPDAGPTASGADEPSNSDVVAAHSLRTGLAHGIHARPAGLLAAAINGLDARVRLISESGARADAASPVALMGLGVARGQRLTVEAAGVDARAALDAVVALLEPMADGPDAVDLGQEVDDVPGASAKAPRPPATGARLHAQVASPGLAAGGAYPLLVAEVSLPAEPGGSVDEEQAALDAALDRLFAHYAQLVSNADTELASVATAHQALLRDPGLRQQAGDAMARGVPAAAAWWQATDSAATQMARLEDRRLRERVDDLRDIGRQVVDVLAGGVPGQAEAVPDGAVVLAENLLPSQLMALLARAPAAVVLAGGGATSHVAILAAARGLPMLVGAGEALLSIEPGTDLCVDAEQGAITVAPAAADRKAFAARVSAEAVIAAEARVHATEPCVMRDGTRIGVMANLASVDEARAAVESGADGCGLLRTEFLFMAREAAPSATEQQQEIQRMADALGDRPLVVRTLDAGADKPIDYLGMAPEDNPALGVRGIRLQLQCPALLDQQLEALLKVQSTSPLRVMLPMVTDVAEVRAVRDRIDALASGLGLATKIRLGIMIETPAAALLADHLAPEVDFFSIGTNDLAQYTLCMDRLAPRLASRLDALHPAVLALIGRTARAAKAAAIEVSVCGAAAADLQAAPVLVGLGIDKLSVPHGRIARLKALLRGLSRADCERLAVTALDCATTDDVRRHAQSLLNAGGPASEG